MKMKSYQAQAQFTDQLARTGDDVLMLGEKLTWRFLARQTDYARNCHIGFMASADEP